MINLFKFTRQDNIFKDNFNHSKATMNREIIKILNKEQYLSKRQNAFQKSEKY
jgi:hypothetical protein